MLFFCFLFLLIYVITLFLAAFFWLKLPSTKTEKIAQNKKLKKIAIIIAIRNEENNIENLLQDILAQTYPSEYIEIIVINDHSTDQSAEIVANYAKKYTNIFLLSLPKFLEGKKQAIQYGISKATSELIFTTDGDCRLQKLHIENICNFFAQTNAKLISSLVVFTKPNFLDTITYGGFIFQSLDFAALIGIGAVSLSIGKATMCNGANLAYTKAIFEEVGGFSGNEHIASGDDEFLLQKIAKKYPKEVHFLKNKDTIVSTESSKTMYDFFQQRKRWASKWKLHQQKHIAIVAIFIFILHSLSLGIMIWGVFEKNITDWAILFWIIKSFAELIFVGLIVQFVGLARYIFFMPFASLLYPVYAISIGIASNQKGFIWKNRKF
jgi:cellulose synthase/poly-beta-1,6-N-acetylglucosamine synthase-like glycosyltransferase